MIPQGHKWRKEATGWKVRAHEFIAFRNFLTNLREEHVIWTPWASAMNQAPANLLVAQTISRKHIFLEGVGVRQWYLGERVTHQSIKVEAFFVPHPPLSRMRSAELLDNLELLGAINEFDP